MKRIFAGLAAILVSLPLFAATVGERSPFAQGHWWDPARSGNGFEIFNAAGQVAVVWFTFDESSRPVWYTAQGDAAGLGSQSWPLLQHRWADGRKAGYSVVGSLRLDVNNPESMKVTYDVAGHGGSWNIEPFRVSGVTNEVDHSGSWYDRSNSGWGLAMTEQGDVLGGAHFTYDPAGNPTWVAGFERNKSSVEYFSATGACPWCSYRATSLQSVGRLSFAFAAEADMTVSNGLTLPMAPGVDVNGARLTQQSRPASWRAADRQLASFDSDATLKAYLDVGMLNVPAMPAGADFSPAPPAATSYSTTNLQEAGVDEADRVKSDGRYVYTFDATTADFPLPTIRIARVDSDGAGVALAGSVSLASGAATPMGTAGLYLHNDKLVSITGTTPTAYMSPVVSVGSWINGKTLVEVMSTANPGAPVTSWRAEIEGHLLSSRRIGERLYLVTRHIPSLTGFIFGTSYAPAVATNRQVLANTTLASLLPKVRVNDGAATPIVATADIYSPPQGSRPIVADMVVAIAIDLSQPRIAQTLAVLGSADAVYASSTNLFVASSRYALRTPYGISLPEPAIYLTDLHEIALGTDRMSLVGSASVEGFLDGNPDLAAFRMSEFQGKLRVVTSSNQMWGAANKNRLTILEPSTLSPGLLRTVSFLPNAQRSQPLGKPGELMYATRFVDERLYAVTFKKIDPLYIVDMADAGDPRIAGALEMPGFSDYLHPLPNGLLLGFGKDAVASGTMGDGQFAWYQGLQLSLFDVSNAGEPRELQRITMGKRGSDSALLRDHHAFSALMRSDGTGTIAIPASIHDGSAPLYGSGDSSFYPWAQSGLMRFEIRGNGTAARLAQLASLVTHAAPQDPAPSLDAATKGARSVLFTAGTIYVAYGRFWQQGLGGSVTGPY